MYVQTVLDLHAEDIFANGDYEFYVKSGYKAATFKSSE